MGTSRCGEDTVFYDIVKQKDLVKRDHILKHLHGRMILGPFEIFFHEGYICRGNKSVISFILKKKPFVNLFCPGGRFYNRYINTTIRTNYLDDDGTGMKPK